MCVLWAHSSEIQNPENVVFKSNTYHEENEERDEFQNKHINLICWMFLQPLEPEMVLYMIVWLSFFCGCFWRIFRGQMKRKNSTTLHEGLTCDARLLYVWPHEAFPLSLSLSLSFALSCCVFLSEMINGFLTQPWWKTRVKFINRRKRAREVRWCEVLFHEDYGFSNWLYVRENIYLLYIWGNLKWTLS